METGFVILTTTGWPECDTYDDFGFTASVSDIYLAYNKAVKARDDMIETDKKDFAANYIEDGEGDRVDFIEGGDDEEKYVQFLLDNDVQYETKYSVKQIYVKD